MSTTAEDDEFGFPDKQDTTKARGNPLAGKKKQQGSDQSLLDSISGGQSGSDDDLLKSLQGGGAVGWNPTEAGETLVGDVLKVGSIQSDHPPFENKPVVTVQTDESGTYRVIGYRSVLQREIEESDPQVGDRIAVKFFGPQKIQKGANAGNTTFIYRVAVRRQS